MGTRINIPWKFIPVSFSLFLILVPAFASTTAPPIVVMGSDNVARTMAYTAFNNNGQVQKNPDFEITQNNVVSVVANGKLTLLSTNGLAFSNAQITDANQKTTDVPILNNQVTFTTPGVFTFTVVSGQYAYTCIVVVGEQPKQKIDKQISNTYVIIDIDQDRKRDGGNDTKGNDTKPDPKPKCDPSYPTVCIKSPPPYLNCGDIKHKNFKVVGKDPHGFDGDNDGFGCDTPAAKTAAMPETVNDTVTPSPEPEPPLTPPPSPEPGDEDGEDNGQFFGGDSSFDDGEEDSGGDGEESGGDTDSDTDNSEEGDDGGNSGGETGGDSFFG